MRPAHRRSPLPYAIALALTALVVLLWLASRRRASGPAPAPRDELRTALHFFRGDIAAARTPEARRALARRIIEVADVQDATFAAHGDIYLHHVQPEPSSACLAAGTCFQANLAFIRDAERRSVAPRPDVDARAERLAAELTIEQLDKALEERIAYVLERAAALDLPSRGEGAKTITLISTGHPVEARRRAALDRVLASHPLRVRELSRAQHPEVVDALGKRLTAAVIIDDKLHLDVVDEEQWLELLALAPTLPPLARAHDDLRLFDAHEHILGGGAAPLRTFVVDNRLAGAVLAALPERVDSSGIPAANDRVLGAADETFLPFVTLDVRETNLLGAMTAQLTRGARGLKLISGHDDYHRELGRPQLDPPALRAVFAELEKRGVPVLWHVNTHLYEAGFLRVLRDFPGLRVVNPHFAGYLGYAPGVVRELLDTYPNLYIDVSCGTQPDYLRRTFEELSARRDAWRKLFIDRPDRFLFGVDMVVSETTSRAHARMLYRLYTSMLADERYDLHFFRAHGASALVHESHHHDGMNGLALPRDVLQKVYFDNAARLYGAR